MYSATQTNRTPDPAHAPHLTEVSPWRLRHPRIASLIEEVSLMLDAGENASLLLVCGLTGVGKTTLGRYLVEAELKAQVAAMAADPGYVPAIGFQVTTSGEKEFSWRLFYRRILEQMEGELDVQRSAYSVDPQSGRLVRSKGPQSNRLSDLRTAVEQSLKQRRTRFIVLDEAVHMMRQCPAGRLEQQWDTLKSLTNESGVQWVLLGSYDLFNLVMLNGQLARRTHVLHFSRYLEDVDEDVRDFRASLMKFGQWLPSLLEVDLLRYAEVLHHNTLGCIGTLYSVLQRLERLVAKRGWSEETLRSALLTEAQVTQIMREVLEGEERIAPGVTHTIMLPDMKTPRRIT